MGSAAKELKHGTDRGVAADSGVLACVCELPIIMKGHSELLCRQRSCRGNGGGGGRSGD